MYVPSRFALPAADLPALVDAWPFATLFTAGAAGPVASHLPLVRDGDRLIGHLARENPQVDDLDGPGLAVFHGPHAMVRSDWYARPETQVPTWNYAAIHATGRLVRLDDPLPALDSLMAALQPGERVPSGEPARDRLVGRLATAIVAFELQVTRWEGKAKLSQNRDAEDRRRVREALADGDAGAQAVAAWMARLG